jgi:hypothetical protein
MHPHDSQALGPTLQRAQVALKSALDEVCHADVTRANTGELIRVEEVLAIANQAAKEAVSVRRRLSVERSSVPAPAAAARCASRELDDENGVRWAAFEVHPATSSVRPSVREHFRDGWLSFDSPVGTRRIAPIPAEWHTMADEQLLELLKTAEPAARRTGRRRGEAAPDSERPSASEGPA